MGNRRMGLGRMEALLEQVDRDLNLENTTLTNCKIVTTEVLKANAAQNWLGIKKFQSFAGTFASIGDGTSAFAEDDVLVELGELDTTVPAGHVAASKFFIDKVVIGITTACGQTLVGNLQLGATSGTAANAAMSSGTEIVGAGVDAFSTLASAAQSEGGTEIDINFNATAGLFHVFAPNINAPIASKYLYVVTHTALNADATAGRFTVMVEYTVY